MLKLKTDFVCTLIDKRTGEDIAQFNATASGDAVFSAGFESGGVASASQSRAIFTTKKLDFKPLSQEVVIDGRTYLLTSVMPSIRRKLGASGKPRIVYVLTLE